MSQRTDTSHIINQIPEHYGAHHSWGTTQELSFIAGLGNHSKSNRSISDSSNYPLRCVLGYIKGSELRERWEGIDRVTVLKMAYAKVKILKGE